jgi:hypothetical protein
VNARRGILVLMVVLLVWPLRAAAHSGGAPVLIGAEAGPYRVYAWIQPEPLYVGQVHLSVAVVRSSQSEAQPDPQDEPVTDATIMARFELVSDATQAITTPVEPLQGLGGFYYETDVILSQAGLWRISLEIGGDDGHGEVSLERQVWPARRINWRLVISGAVVLVLLVGLMGGWNRLQTRE